MTEGITAKLVFDGGEVTVPDEMGTPRYDQLQGTAAEQLSELAGRVCYDSLGLGRASFTIGDKQGYHDHIKQVGHGSVWEHYNFTIQFNDLPPAYVAAACCNRPGVFFRSAGLSIPRITVNLRSAYEWESDAWGRVAGVGVIYEIVNSAVAEAGSVVAPNIIGTRGSGIGRTGFNVVVPETDDEKWISMYLTGSRGLSHELVRHGDFTAISQRSTRYVDESEGNWVQHPLVTQYLNDSPGSRIALAAAETEATAKSVYRLTAESLEADMISRGVDKTSARKQARGAARGYLGNALKTELIFSASVAQWKRMLRQRATVFADAEIRELFCLVLGQLKASAYASSFDGWALAPSPDGIGCVAVESL